MTRQPPAYAPMSARGWMALGGAAAVVSAVILGVLVTTGSTSVEVAGRAVPATAAQAPTTTPLPDLGGPRSFLVPEMTLPVGARPYSGKQPTPPGFEFWEVPGNQRELVAQMRSELPTFGPLNGMPWCGEVTDAMTSWAWGSAAETIGVSFIDGGVMITRLPQPRGCRP
ncbi:MAG: hypothetical protein JO280_20740 [Mycobacteriaceae bacterium]|nr:hypothetical protein [Mycobacteriaceae bacterium]